MKKIFSIMLLAGFASVLILPLFASAADQPLECIKLRRTISINNDWLPNKIPDTALNVIVGAPGGSCPFLSGKAMPKVGDTNIPSVPPGLTTLKYKSVASADDTAVIFAAIPYEKWGLVAIINTIQTVVDWFFAVLVAVSVLLAIIGAFSILTAGGSPEKVSTGRGYILYAAIGLAVAFIARAVPSLVKGIMGF